MVTCVSENKIADWNNVLLGVLIAVSLYRSIERKSLEEQCNTITVNMKQPWDSCNCNWNCSLEIANSCNCNQLLSQYKLLSLPGTVEDGKGVILNSLEGEVLVGGVDWFLLLNVYRISLGFSSCLRLSSWFMCIIRYKGDRRLLL